MKRQVFGPTVLSFIPYCGVNLFFMLAPLILLSTNIENIQYAAGLIFMLGFFVYPRIIADMQWVMISDDDIHLLKILPIKLRWKEVYKIKMFSNMTYARMASKFRGIYVRQGYLFHTNCGYNDTVLSTSMWSDATQEKFYWFLSEKAKRYQFSIEKEEASINEF